MSFAHSNMVLMVGGKFIQVSLIFTKAQRGALAQRSLHPSLGSAKFFLLDR